MAINPYDSEFRRSRKHSTDPQDVYREARLQEYEVEFGAAQLAEAEAAVSVEAQQALRALQEDFANYEPPDPYNIPITTLQHHEMDPTCSCPPDPYEPHFKALQERIHAEKQRAMR